MSSSPCSFRTSHPHILARSSMVPERRRADPARQLPGLGPPDRPPLRDLTSRPHHQIELLVVEEFIGLTHDGQQIARGPGRVGVEWRWQWQAVSYPDSSGDNRGIPVIVPTMRGCPRDTAAVVPANGGFAMPRRSFRATSELLVPPAHRAITTPSSHITDTVTGPGNRFRPVVLWYHRRRRASGLPWPVC